MLLWFALCGGALAKTGDAACIECHKDYVIAAPAGSPAALPCGKCHDAADTAVVPHRQLGRLPKGQIAANSQSCLSCHDKEPYANTRHGSLAAACTGCHDAHSAKHGKLLAEDTGSLCLACHKAADFKAKVVHKPVAGGDCADCHAMHGTEHAGLLSDALTKTCLACHGGVKKKPHAAVGPSKTGHPTGDEKPNLKDPARPQEEYSCSSCHYSHKSDRPKLMRFDLRSPQGYCVQCHKI